MSSTVLPGAGVADSDHARKVDGSSAVLPSRIERIPWYIWCGALALTCIEVGSPWDISWHRSIGRDTFWNPAHMVVQSAGILTALVCGYLVFTTTFRPTTASRAASVKVLGLHAPLGAFIAAWGGIAMVVSAPFDNWWHEAYGLDVRVISPPHALLILGAHSLALGMLTLLLSVKNRAIEAGSPAVAPLERMFLYMAGLILTSQMVFISQRVGNSALHTTGAYNAVAAIIVIALVVTSQALPSKWPATVAAAIYSLWGIGAILILPLFPAHPKLGPVFYPVTHMVPADFPLLLIVPAMVLDLVWRRTRAWPPLPLAILSGVLFMAVFFPVEWHFAAFLTTKYAQNRFFGMIYHDFSTQPKDVIPSFMRVDTGSILIRGFLEATIISICASWVGIYFGRWLRGVRR